MKKTFKRFLSSALAAVMTASVLSVGMVTSASAAEIVPEGTTFHTTTDNVTTWDFTKAKVEVNYAAKNIGDTVDGIYAAKLGKVQIKRDGYFNTTSSNNVEPIFGIPVDYDSGTIVITNQTSYKDRYIAKVVAGSAVETTKTTLSADGSTFKYSAGDLSTYDGKKYVDFTTYEKEAKITKIEVIGDAQMDTYTITGNLGADNELNEAFTVSGVDDAVVTVEGGKYTITKSVLSGKADPFSAAITVSQPGYSVNGKESETLTLSGGTDKAYTAQELTFKLNELKIEPTDTGYTWTGSGLISKTVSTDYAYASDNSSSHNVTVSNGTARVIDTGSGSTQLIMPMTANIKAINSGKLTFSGTISDIDGSGGKWTPIQFGTAGIRTGSSSSSDAVAGQAGEDNFSLAFNAADSKVDYTYTSIEHKNVTSFDYKVEFDFDAKKISLTLTTGGKTDTVTKTFDTELAPVDQIVSITRGSAANNMTLSDITIAYESSAVTKGLEQVEDEKTAIYKDPDNNVTYLIVGVSAQEAADNNNLTLNVGDSTNSTTEVYKSFEDGTVQVSAEDINADYLFAIKVTEVTDAAQVSKLKTLTRELS